jgi:homopolymeric O-antigen transport system ATP-binding protein
MLNNMSNFAIRVEHVSKKYEIMLGKRRHDTLRDQVMHGLASLLQSNGHSRAVRQTFWALKDVSLEVNPGEVVGLIGRNGAGKSTLLKILSRITQPTTGSAEIRGRVGSLLEVGTGFHGELTGRENIYLNGAILGMKKAEIDRKFDGIVDFAGVEHFIDTPLKRYSSGMHMRLAFAVAAQLEPEILLVDEVLAVGDADFTKKCLKKMENVGQEGRTVIFVSHSMASVTRLCQRVILLDHGVILADGPAQKVVSHYLNSGLGIGPAREWQDSAKAPGGEVVRLLSVRVRAADGEVVDLIDIRQPVVIEMEYEVLKSGYMILPNFHFRNELGELAFCSHEIDSFQQRTPRPCGRYVSTARIPGNLLAEGTMLVSAGCETMDPSIFQFYESDVVAFQVVDHQHPDSARGDFKGDIKGIVRPRLPWRTQLVGPFDP